MKVKSTATMISNNYKGLANPSATLGNFTFNDSYNRAPFRVLSEEDCQILETQ